ncbi:MAG: YihY/virulence factor BrkB family protein [Alphaproteobacteria bacterium]|nr:YihY/virulence factor BrkB family protein [Alphaproteobacteria bacterium]
MAQFLRVFFDSTARLFRNGGILFAGHMAFTAMLSFFPFLIFLTTLAGFVGEPQTAQAFVDRVFDLVPGRVNEVLRPAVDEVLATRRGGLLTFSLIGALWIASSGVEAIRHVLNRAYNVEEIRPFWRRRVESLIVVVTGGTLTLALSLSVILGPAIWSVLTSTLALPASAQGAVGTIRDLVAVAILFSILAVLHATLPCRRQRLRDVWPGAALTALLWIALATGFSLYLSNLTDFNVTYGSLGGVVLTLVYFHASAVLFIYGAEVNAAIIAARSKPSA